MCKYAPLGVKCIYEGYQPEPGFCKTAKLKHYFEKMASSLPVIGKFAESLKDCRDFIGIPSTDDTWYKELMGK